MKQSMNPQTNEHSRGLALFAALGDLDPTLVAEAEVDTAQAPVAAAVAPGVSKSVPESAHLFNMDELDRRKPRGKSHTRRRMWGTVAASLAAVLVLAGVIALIGMGGGLLPWSSHEPGGNPADTAGPTYTALNILLPGKVPFAAEAGDFTISVDPMIAEDANGLSVTMQAGALGAPLSNAGGWRLENLTDPDWNGDVVYELIAWSLDGTEGTYTQRVESLSLTEPLIPGIYRLHAMATQNGKSQSIAYCEFAVDDEKGTYKTWTEADLADVPVLDATYTISTDATVPYGLSEIRITATAKNGGHTIMGPATFRLVKLDGEPAGAGACFVGKEGLNFVATIDANPNSNAVASAEQTCQIVNPAACTPGRYRIYNVADDGTVYATCEFEIVGDPLGWPGESGGAHDGETHPFPEAEEKPFTITASIGYFDDGQSGYLSITYKGAKQGEPILHPSLNYRVVKIEGVENPADWVIISTSEAIEMVMPTEENNKYAVFTKSHAIQNAEAMLPGVYRVYALNYEEEFIDYYDVVLGAEDPFPEAEEKPYTIKAEIATSKYAPDRMYLYITYTATEKGVVINPNLTGIVIHKIYGEADEQDPYIDGNEYGLEVAEPRPDEYCVLQDSRTIINLEHMKPGVYRIYSLNYYGTAYIDYYDVMWDGYTLSDTKETETFGDETDVYEPLPEPDPEPEESYTATLTVNGTEVDCGDVLPQIVYIPANEWGDMVKPATYSYRVPLFATLRALDPTFSMVVVSEKRIDLIYNGMNYYIEKDGIEADIPILWDVLDDQNAAILSHVLDKTTGYAAYVGDEILVDVDSLCMALNVMRDPHCVYVTDLSSRSIQVIVTDMPYSPIQSPAFPTAEQNYPYRVQVTEEDGTIYVHVTGGYNDNWRLECLEGKHAGEVSIPNVAPTGLPPNTTTVWSTKIYLPEGDDYEGIYYLHNVAKENGEWRSVVGATFAVGSEYEAWLDYIRATTGGGQ